MYNALQREESPYVRLHIAGALATRKVDGSSYNLALGIAHWEGDNPQVLRMVWYALEATTRSKPEQALAIIPDGADSALRRNAVRYILAKTNDLPTSLDRLLVNLVSRTRSDTLARVQAHIDILTAIREELAGRKDVPTPRAWQSTFASIQKITTPEAIRTRRLRAAEALGVILGDEVAIDTLLRRITDTRAELEDRQDAVSLLAPRKLPDFANTLHGLLDEPALRGTAIRALAGFPDAGTPAAILKAYPKFTAEEKIDAVQTLAARVAFAKKLLDAVEKGTVPRADVPVTAARQILALNDKPTSERLEKVWGKITPVAKERAALMKKWKAILTEDALKKADVVNGRGVFTKHCAACHKMFGEGQAVGPELTGSQRANLDYVLENVLDPSAVVPREYQMINFTLADERVVGGIIVRETKDAVTVRTVNDTLTIPTADIVTRKQTPVSIMPEGLFDQMKPDEVRDLVAYLRVKEQVPIPKK
jgi:putative heme-binding domain-containing protein